MSYIIKKNDPLVNVKLTNKGRRNLASGTLTFSSFMLGDSEMDYSNDDKNKVNILRPSENQLGLKYPQKLKLHSLICFRFYNWFF